MSKSIVDGRRRSEAYGRGHGGKRSRRSRRELNAAIDEGLRPNIYAMTPRCYVMVMTMASAELGRALKKAIRDELYERRRKAELIAHPAPELPRRPRR